MGILKNDEVTMIKEFDGIKKIGEVFQVANITDTMIVLRDKYTKVAIAAVKIDEFDKYFTKNYPKGKWTDWIGFSDERGNLMGYYRTNQKRVEVKTISNKIFKGKASCNTMDDFSLEKGWKLAMARCKRKIVSYYRDKLSEEISSLDSELKMINKYIENFGKE